MTEPDYILPELDKAIPSWNLVADCYAGQKAIIAKGEQYLPNPSPYNEDPAVRKKRYEDYQKRAVYYNVVRRTAKALCGLVFSKYPTFTLPFPEIEHDVDGAGYQLVQQARHAMLMVLLKGRGGLLADFPVTQGLTRAEMKSQNAKPVIRIYEPENIINWRTAFVDGRKKLTLMVLQEKAIKSDDGFKAEYEDQLLILRLREGVAISQVARKHNGSWVYDQENIIRDNSGRGFDVIPFTFFGADDNDETIDDAPLYDLAEINIAHYRDSADYQESNFITAQPSLFITGVTDTWYENVLKDNPIRLGSRTANVLGVGANAFLLQPNAHNVLAEAMDKKESQMVSIGANLIEPKSGNKTATEVASDNADNASVLSSVANNLSDAYTVVLGFCGRYIGVVSDVVFTLNTRFDTAKMTTAERQQLIAEWQSGAISWHEMRAKLVEDEIATLEDADEAKEIIDAETSTSMFKQQPATV